MMNETLSYADRDNLHEFIQLVGGTLKKDFGDAFASLYLIGSLAHGDYSQRFSDINVVALFKYAIQPGEILRFRKISCLAELDHMIQGKFM